MNDFWTETIIPKLEKYFLVLLNHVWNINTEAYQGINNGFNEPMYRWIKTLSNDDHVAFSQTMDNLVLIDEFKEMAINIVKEAIESEISRLEKLGISFSIEEKKKQDFTVLNWNWYVDNNLKSFSDFLPYLPDWKYPLLHFLCKKYENLNYGKYQDFYQNARLKLYLDEHKIVSNMEDNYGLITLDNHWSLVQGNPPKICIKELSTHILTKHIPNKIVLLLQKLRSEHKLTLSVRPDYNICGDRIKNIGLVNEELEFGKAYQGRVSKIIKLSKFFDVKNYNDALIIVHDQEGKNIYFEELLDDMVEDKESIVTNLLHIEYISEGNVDFIKHMDHEYIFYSINEYIDKLSDIRTRGKERKKYKTFKIDDAHIKVDGNPENNIIIEALKSYFTKHNLIEEFFNDYSACLRDTDAQLFQF